MEHRLTDLPQPQTTHPSSSSTTSTNSPTAPRHPTAAVHTPAATAAIAHALRQQRTSAATAATATDASAPSCCSTDTEKTITQLEVQVEEQRLLRLQDAKQVEEKAAKIKEWVTNKLRELEEQNQVLREQNVKCNQQLQLLRNHLQVGIALFMCVKVVL